MKHEDYPALFLAADAASNRHQATFVRLVRSEYWTLLLAAVFSMSFLNGVIYHVLYAGVFIIGLLLLVSRAQSKPEQWWYRCRALAESVKTLTWRYMMHATPFDIGDAEAKIKLRDELHEMFRQNQETAKQITSDWSGNDQITVAMEEIRSMSRTNRMEYYLGHRVDEQRSWYKRKSIDNKRSAKFWIFMSISTYVLAGSMVLIRIGWPDWLYWPIEPLIVAAASIVGWMQIKKFNELAAAYTVAAHEIGLIRPKVGAVRNGELSP